ncbi:DUF4184 family protein [Actinomadura alba]|uniref:DUF4184 family protein n=1 Tax=Actinomadura alba TaxID=406431 RepID=A0ABR7LS90_9ACTN|nr:DUF4184 family protein [Actinomadura alba]MBC6467459.1 DUF4184 family protein [Actinomadura alba]
MPFTLSHPAIVLPLARGRLVPSAMVMGSMAPDLPYFLPFFKERWLTHMFIGTVTVDLGLALLLLAVFHPLLKWPLIALCPAWVRGRVAVPARGFDELRMNDLGWVLVSAAIGTFSHVSWDAFTHPDAPGVRWWPALAEPLAFGLPGFKVAQYGSGAIGLLVIAGWAFWWLRHATPAADEPAGLPVRHRVATLTGTVVAGLAGSCYGALSWLPLNSDRSDLHARTVGGVIGAMAFATLALIAYSLVFHALRRRAPRPADGSSPRRATPARRPQSSSESRS